MLPRKASRPAIVYDERTPKGVEQLGGGLDDQLNTPDLNHRQALHRRQPRRLRAETALSAAFARAAARKAVRA
jgi:hypothetical protein